MNKKILSASVTSDSGTICLTPSPGLNILRGEHPEAALLALADVFSGKPSLNVKAKIAWDKDTVLFVSAAGGACGVERVGRNCPNPARAVKRFHKQRFLAYGNRAHILDGAEWPGGTSGASDLLNQLQAVLAQGDERPLFICNFPERLDAVIDLLNATGRQVFITVPYDYNIQNPEEKEYGTAIHDGSNL